MEEWSHRAARPLALTGLLVACPWLLAPVPAQATDPFRDRSTDFSSSVAIEHGAALKTDRGLVFGLVRAKQIIVDFKGVACREWFRSENVAIETSPTVIP
jgi:hypothetical protein